MSKREILYYLHNKMVTTRYSETVASAKTSINRWISLFTICPFYDNNVVLK